MREAGAALAAGLLLALAFGGCSSDADPAPAPSAVDDAGAVERWLEQYERVEEHRHLVRAREIFARVSDASLQSARLEVRRLSQAPQALALVHRVVVVTPSVLDLAFDGVSRAEGDARFAFVVAHELAHLKFNDFWHLVTFGRTTEPELRELLEQTPKNRRQIELKADGQGALAALDAGYDPHLLLAGESSFFAEWMDLVPGRFGDEESDHPSAAEREQLLRQEVERILARVEDYERAVARMKEADEIAGAPSAGPGAIRDAEPLYRAAIEGLEGFREVFDGKRVLTNLAVAHLRIASGHLLECDGSLVSRYFLSPVVDEGTVANRKVPRGPGEAFEICADSRYAESIRQAIDLLESAVARDPSYFDGHWNLGVAYFLDRQTAGAKRQAEILLQLAPDDSQAQELDLLADLLAADLGNRRLNREAIVEDLEALHRRFPEDVSIAFNLASALTHDADRGAEEAHAAWRRFLELQPAGAYAAIARSWVEPVEPPAPPQARPTR